MRNTAKISIFALAGALALAMPSPASAGPAAPPYLADATDPAVTTLATDLGISITDAQRRIGWQEPAIRMGDELAALLTDSFGGLWIDEKGGGRVKVGLVTGRGSLAQAKQVARSWQLQSVTDFVPVRHSKAQLDEDSAWLASLAEAAGTEFSTGTQIDRNRLVLRLPQTPLSASQVSKLDAAKARLGERLVTETWSGKRQNTNCARRSFAGISNFDCDAPIRGGVRTYINVNQPQCTAAFSARSKSDGAWYLMTAGHCGSIGTEMRAYQPVTGLYHVIGDVHNSRNVGNDDYAIIRVNRPGADGWDVRNWIYVEPTGETAYDPRYTITGVSSTAVGVRVCISGATSGTDCGKVTEVGVDGPGSLSRAEVCATYGDSGSPIYSDHKARGIQVAVEAFDCQHTLFQGVIEAANAMNVSVVTS